MKLWTGWLRNTSISREAARPIFALDSHQKALAAWENGDFEAEVIPVEIQDRKKTTLVERDERPRADSTLEKLAHLKPVFRGAEDGGTITAANASGITDGAAALVSNEELILAKNRGP